MRDVRAAAVTGFVLSNAAQLSCIPTLRAVCQSKKGKDMWWKLRAVKGRKAGMAKSKEL